MLTADEVHNIRWMMPGEIDLFVNSIFGVPSLEEQTRRMTILKSNGMYSAEEKALALLYETVDLILKDGTLRAIEILNNEWGLSRLQSREMIQNAREELRIMHEGDTAAHFYEIQARIENFISRCRTGHDRREEATAIKMLMQLFGFTRDRDLGGMREIADTLKRLDQRAVVIDHKIIEEGGRREPNYEHKPGLRRDKPIEIPAKAQR